MLSAPSPPARHVRPALPRPRRRPSGARRGSRRPAPRRLGRAPPRRSAIRPGPRDRDRARRRRARVRLRPRVGRRARREARLPPRPRIEGAGLARSERDGRMVMYELTEHGRTMLARRPRDGARMTPPIRAARRSAGPQAPRRVPAISPERYRGSPARELLSWLSLAWMTVEGAVAIVAGDRRRLDRAGRLRSRLRDRGLRERDHHLALHRPRGCSPRPPSSARRSSWRSSSSCSRRTSAIESVRALVGGEHPEVSGLGIGARDLDVILMPVLGIAKQRSPTSSARPPPRARAGRTCSAPTSRARCSSACSGTRSPAPGGSTRRRAADRRRRRQGGRARRGAATDAASARRSTAESACDDDCCR